MSGLGSIDILAASVCAAVERLCNSNYTARQVSLLQECTDVSCRFGLDGTETNYTVLACLMDD